MFLSVFVSTQVLGAEIYVWAIGKVPSGSNLLTMSLAGVFLFLMLLPIEAAILGPAGQLYFSIPLANFFWASMIPSGWLWLFIGSSIVTRSLVGLQPTLGFLTHALDVECHPVRSIGAVASVVVGVMTHPYSIHSLPLAVMDHVATSRI